MEVTSPTVATKYVLITTTIDTAENQDVAVIDNPGTFLTSDQDEEVIVILEKDMVDAMLEIDAELYRKYVINGQNGKIYLFVHLNKMIYGKLKAALTSHQKLSK